MSSSPEQRQQCTEAPPRDLDGAYQQTESKLRPLIANVEAFQRACGTHRNFILGSAEGQMLSADFTDKFVFQERYLQLEKDLRIAHEALRHYQALFKGRHNLTAIASIFPKAVGLVQIFNNPQYSVHQNHISQLQQQYDDLRESLSSAAYLYASTLAYQQMPPPDQAAYRKAQEIILQARAHLEQLKILKRPNKENREMIRQIAENHHNFGVWIFPSWRVKKLFKKGGEILPREIAEHEAVCEALIYAARTKIIEELHIIPPEPLTFWQRYFPSWFKK